MKNDWNVQDLGAEAGFRGRFEVEGLDGIGLAGMAALEEGAAFAAASFAFFAFQASSFSRLIRNFSSSSEAFDPAVEAGTGVEAEEGELGPGEGDAARGVELKVETKEGLGLDSGKAGRGCEEGTGDPSTL